VIVVRPKEGDRPTEKLLDDLKRLNRRLPDFKRLAGYVVLPEELPRTASLKIKRNVLAERLRTMSRAEVIEPLPVD
jgi:acyl-coenzyme A synthetase/AMP-(fatty) acid ligase